MEEQKAKITNGEIKAFHLINENGELQDGFQDHMKEYKYGKDYQIISIIGSQSSGKSTLLNKLFETDFEVLNSTVERRQVTKGIWLASGIKSNFIVLDVEGSDSRERWDERHFYEQSTALFALALSQVLVINLWTHEVGRFSGSQYGILKVIFEMNIKLFGQDQMKQLIFILRDYSDAENFSEIRELIEGDINRIWDEIAKPENFKAKSPDQFFKIDFFKLSHMRYAIKEFDAGVENLKQVFFNKEAPDYLLKNFDYTSNVLLNDVPLFAQQIWETIKSNKDLNLPSEKIVIANMRCDQIKQESMEVFIPEFKAFHKTNTKRQIYHQFGEDGKQILANALKYFDENSASYSDDVKEQKRVELETELLSKFYGEYQIQKKNLHQVLLAQYIKLVELISFDKGEMQDLMGTLNETREKQIQQFQSALYKSQIKDNLWAIDEYVTEFKEILAQQQIIFVDKFLNFFLMKKEKEMRKEVQKVINANFFDLNLNFWNNIKVSCIEILKQNEDNILLILEKSFQLDLNDSKEKLINFKQDFTSTIESELKRKCQDLHFYIMKQFKNFFGRKENGAPINWRIIQQEEIEPKFTEAKAKTLELMNQFQLFQLNMSEIGGVTQKQEETVGKQLIEEEDFKKLVASINLDMDSELKDAMDTYNSKPESPIPKWLWAVLVFFMYDEVFLLLISSWCIVPTLLTIIFIGVSFAIGQKQLPLQTAKQTYSIIDNYFGPYLYKLGVLLGLK